jgi:hypothetical protein
MPQARYFIVQQDRDWMIKFRGLCDGRERTFPPRMDLWARSLSANTLITQEQSQAGQAR